MTNVDPIPTAPQPSAGHEIKFACWVPNLSGGLVVSKIERRTHWGAAIEIKEWDMSVQRKIESIVEGVPALPRPREAAHVIKDDAEAIAVAHALAAEFVEGSAERDRTRRLPVAELDSFSQSGLWSINVPRRFGGPELS